MLNINSDDISESYAEFRQLVKKGCSFAVTGLTSILRMFLVSKIKFYSGKKVLFITATEQNALKYRSDFSGAFNLEAAVMPFLFLRMFFIRSFLSISIYKCGKQV